MATQVSSSSSSSAAASSTTTAAQKPAAALSATGGEGVSNDGSDNVNSDYIIYVNDIIGSNFNQRYKVLDSLGQGTFGQVVKCQNCDTNELVAVKILKNKPAYFQQGSLEIKMLMMLNNNYDPDNKSNILRLLDSFVYKNHLCIVIELLSVNLFELIKQNSFKGLSTNLIKVFLIQILDALIVLSRANMIHCDLKPENILLQRSPEVLVGVQYSSSIDMWSLGCISAELFLGLPLFPGTSEYNQICRITEMRGVFSDNLLDRGKNSLQYFKKVLENGKLCYVLKTEDEYSRDSKTTLQPYKKYFNYKTLPDIIQNYGFKKNMTPQDIEKEKQNRIVFTDFVSGLLNMDPEERWTPMQAKDHPFITGSPFTGPFQPDPAKKMFASTAPKSIPMFVPSSAQGSFNGSGPSSLGQSFGKKMNPLSFKQAMVDQYNNFPESYSPRGLYGPFSNNPQTSQLALGQSPSMFGTPSSMFPPIPYSPLYPNNNSYYGSWGSDNGIPPPQYQQQQQQQYQNSRRGRSKSDAPNSDDGQYTEEKPPIYPLNSPQRKRSQSGLVQMDQHASYGYPYIPRIHLDQYSNRYRSHSYGEQFQQQGAYPQNKQHQLQQMQQMQQQQQQPLQSPTLLQQSAPQIFDHGRMQQQQQRYQQQQQQQQMQFGQSPPSQQSPPIPQSPQMMQQFPLTPQLMSADPMSPLMSSDTSLNWNPSPSEEMLFPLEQLLPSQQQTPQLSSQQSSQNPLSKSQSSPVGSRYLQPPFNMQQQQQPWKMDDMASNFASGLHIGDQAGSWQPPTSPWGIPQFSIQQDHPQHYDDGNSMISFSPYDYRNSNNIFQSPPSNNQQYTNNNIKQSPPSRPLYADSFQDISTIVKSSSTPSPNTK
eukprot:gene4038-4677_t